MPHACSTFILLATTLNIKPPPPRPVTGRHNDSLTTLNAQSEPSYYPYIGQMSPSISANCPHLAPKKLHPATQIFQRRQPPYRPRLLPQGPCPGL